MTTIAIYGKPGAGKTTLIEKLKSHFAEEKTVISLTWEQFKKQPVSNNTAIQFIEIHADEWITEPSFDVNVYVDTNSGICLARRLNEQVDNDKTNLKLLLKDCSTQYAHSKKFKAIKERADIVVNNNPDQCTVNLMPLVEYIASKSTEPHLPAATPNIISPTFNAKKSTQCKGVLYIISGPSGAGKTTLIKKFIEKNPHIERLVPYSSRQPRVGESEGNPYRFISPDHFKQLLATEVFLQHFTDYGKDYGIPLQEVKTKLAEGKSLIIDVSTTVLQQIKNKISSVKSIYICPKKMSDLLIRLRSRGDEENAIEKRYPRSIAELENASYAEYDYLLVNEALEQACDELAAIMQAQQITLNEQLNKNAETLARFKIYRILNKIITGNNLNFDIENCKIETLSSLNNASYKLSNENQTYFLRIPRQIDDGYRITAELEHQHLTQVQALDLYPAPIYYDHSTCAYLASFLTQHQLLTDQLLQTNKEILKDVVKVLKKLHQSTLFHNDYTPIKYDEPLLIKIKQTTSGLPDDLDNIAILCHRVAELLESTCKTRAPCNNDISPYNLLYHAGIKSVIISDWECSGNNDLFWDLAKLSVEANFKLKQDQELLTYYFDYFDKQDLTRLNLYKLLIEYHLAVWAKWQACQNNTATTREKFESMFAIRLDNCRKHINRLNFKDDILLIQKNILQVNRSTSVIPAGERIIKMPLNPPSASIKFQLESTVSTSNLKSIGFWSHRNISPTTADEQTLLILKPDILAQNKLGAVIHFIENKGFKIIACKLKQMLTDDVYALYPKIKDQEVCYDVIDLMTSGPVFLAVIEGKNVAESLRKIKGATNPQHAEPTTLRHQFGTNVKWNAAHCSDNAQEAKREIQLFFTKDELCSHSKLEHETNLQLRKQ